jgi:hypothetical protein
MYSMISASRSIYFSVVSICSWEIGSDIRFALIFEMLRGRGIEHSGDLDLDRSNPIDPHLRCLTIHGDREGIWYLLNQRMNFSLVKSNRRRSKTEFR